HARLLRNDLEVGEWPAWLERNLVYRRAVRVENALPVGVRAKIFSSQIASGNHRGVEDLSVEEPQKDLGRFLEDLVLHHRPGRGLCRIARNDSVRDVDEREAAGGEAYGQDAPLAGIQSVQRQKRLDPLRRGDRAAVAEDVH